MTGRKLKYDRIRIPCSMGADDFLCRLAKRRGIVFHVAETAYHHSAESGQQSGAFQSHHHTVYVIEVFVQVLNKKHLAVQVGLLRRAEGGIQQAQVTTHQ